MYLVLLGPPGAGKGTQAERLCSEFKLPHVASGDLFRENLQDETELGKLAKGFMDAGQLVPDDVTIAMVGERISRPDCAAGVLLDGFPRTKIQAEGLDRILSDMGKSLTGVLYIAVPDETLVQRLSGRRICKNCQTPYHIEHNPPKVEGICDNCGGELYQRDDDKPETIQARLDVFHKQTAPLIAYYQAATLLHEVDGVGGIDEVSERLIKTVKRLRGEASKTSTEQTNAKPQITKFKFGSIQVDGKKYTYDIIIRLDGSVQKRKKKLSKEKYGTSHKLSRKEMKFVYEKGASSIVIGSGQSGNVKLSRKARKYLQERDCEVLIAPSQEAVLLWNNAGPGTIALFHITC
ncbi:MAG: adenylate kinase [Anaerolineales bacterium]|nr:adenylate kinase [Anaerolineales bacterium]